MNKYKKSMNKISINNNVREKLILKTNKRKKKNLLLPIAFASLILLISVGIVNASYYIYTTKSKAKFSNGIFETTTQKINTKTNFDEIYYKGKDTKIYENISIKEAEELIGINLLSFDNDKEHLVSLIPYSSYNYDKSNQGKITQIAIDYDPYIIIKSEKLNEEKSIRLFAIIYTTNFSLKDEEYDNTMNDNSDLEYLGEYEIPNLNTKGYILKYEYKKEDGWNNSTVGTIGNSLNFSYNGIPYTLQGINISKEELLEYASKLK